MVIGGAERVNWLLELVARFWPAWFIILWARAAMILGSAFALIAVVVAIRRYIFDQPLSNDSWSTTQTIVWFLAFGGGGAAFALIGFLTYRWKLG